MKKLISLAIVATVALTGCSASGAFIPAGGISDQQSGTAVKAEAKNTNWFGFTPMKEAQVQTLIRDTAKKCPGGEVVNALYNSDDLNLGIVSFEKRTISGYCK